MRKGKIAIVSIVALASIFLLFNSSLAVAAGPGGDTAEKGGLTKRYTSITPMSPKTITETDLDTTDTALTEIYVDVKDPVVGVQMTIQKMSEKPEDAGEPVRNVYRYISVEKEYLDDSNIEQAHMRFKVRINWIQDNNINQSSITLYRYSWRALTAPTCTSKRPYPGSHTSRLWLTKPKGW
jgi:PGF-pre-PGF domain-containing protein